MPNKSEAIRIHRIQIRNVLGITELEIRPGQITIIDGKNASGKTSVLSAIRSACGGGHDATLLRNGAESGEVVLLLEDGKRIEERITREGSTRKVTDPEMGKLSKPQTFLDGLFDKFSLNPIDFLTSRPDKRVELLLESLPMKLSEMDVADVVDLCTTKHDLSGHALSVIQSIHKDLYDQRTGVNRSLKDKLSTLEELGKALPAESETVDGTQLEDAQKAWLDFQRIVLESRQVVSNKHNEARLAEETQCVESVRNMEQERDRRIEEIRKDTATRIEAARAITKDAVSKLQEARDQSLVLLQAEVDTKEQPLKDRLADVRAKLESYTRATSARQHMETMRTGAKELESTSYDLTTALTQLDELKAALLERLPIKGMEVRDADIFLDGAPFDRVNEARKVQVAIEIAQLRCGKLPLVLVDGLERLDVSTFDAFITEVKKRNIQLIGTRVKEGELATTVA